MPVVRDPKPALAPGREALRDRVLALHGELMRPNQIARELGLPLTTVRRWVDPDYAERSRATSRKTKEGYRGRCACGRPTSGCNGPGRAPTVCAECFREAQHEARYWTEERLLEAAREWARRRGRPPRAQEWLRVSADPDGYRFPSMSLCYTQGRSRGSQPPWPNWNAFLTAAGLAATPRGRHPRTGTNGIGRVERAILELLASGAGRTNEDIAAACRVGQRSATDATRSLYKRGCLAREGAGQPRNPYRWSLAGSHVV